MTHKNPGRSGFNLQNEDFPALPAQTSGYQQDASSKNNQEVSLGPISQTQPSSHDQVPVGDRNALDRYIQSNYEGTAPSEGQQLHAQQQQTFSNGSDRYGLLGLLGVIRMTDRDTNTLALGIDLTTLGLDLNSPEMLYKTFSSPLAKGPEHVDPEYSLPSFYLMTPPQSPPLQKIHSFTDQSLFYIFYSMPRDILQHAAATELYARDWRYHRDLKLWFANEAPIDATGKAGERDTYVYFDINTWQKVRKPLSMSYDNEFEGRRPDHARPEQ
ncbi:hypothetical protein SARC_09722 [Sphaeroforma arctica JP610]|uniref:NOT2/NOT3/NOT5 C-terminal domain-containing protein n=1 Tax=Sphaeroforma arctica JP610 TaxID=667725 RepID=A0A0L0FM21_9EUKA|nr:hypothetical protein SARC_09722 [Sphaeroforma arctica JP610]KNC77827.1 hypothetical protein SARC_09722 [Sphaeroforma arctica JP610]|eukprot:XP_014151729.1 hypothetical protein SARC_09722 [Sphaeroforma arctica JP610]